MTMLWVIGLCVILGLGAYAALLWRKVFSLRDEQAKQLEEEKKKQAERKAYLLESINVIARVLVDNQANMTECAIRLKVLLENLYPGDCPKPEFRALYELAWATSHMPILEQRKQHSKKEIREFDKERESLEEKMKEDVLKAAQAVIDYDFQ